MFATFSPILCAGALLLLAAPALCQCTLTLSPSSAQVSDGASTGSFMVTASMSSCSRNAISSDSWLTVTFGQSGTGGGSVGYSVTSNTTYATRTGTISVSGTLFTLTQAAPPCPALSFAPASQAVPAAGGSFSIAITSPCVWTASSSANWIALAAAAGTSSGALSYSVAANTTNASRSGTIQIDTERFAVTQAAAAPTIQFSAGSLVNGASFLYGPIAPGELISIFGAGLGPAQAAGLQTTAGGGSITTALAGTQVLFNGIAAPMTYVSATQVNAIVPFEVAGSATAQVSVVVEGVASSPVTETVASSSPAIFAVSGGSGQGAILNQDNTPNSAANPAAAGSVLQVFCTGFGQTTPSGVDGQIAGPTSSVPVQNVTAAIGGINASVLYAGSSYGLVSGVIQVNVLIPSGVSLGNVPLVINVGGSASPAGTTVAIH